MGLGKTVQSIAFMAALHTQCVERPALVVVPLSTMRNWEREFATWAPHLNVVSLSGNQAARQVPACTPVPACPACLPRLPACLHTCLG